jgi:hypothetical protein
MRLHGTEPWRVNVIRLAAGKVRTRNIPANVVALGNPARVIREI